MLYTSRIICMLQLKLRFLLQLASLNLSHNLPANTVSSSWPDVAQASHASKSESVCRPTSAVAMMCRLLQSFCRLLAAFAEHWATSATCALEQLLWLVYIEGSGVKST